MSGDEGVSGSEGSELPMVHGVILNFRGWRDTLECLESVLRGDYPRLHLIVVDNGSPDDSLARIRAWARGERGSEAAPGNAALASLTTPAVPKPVALRELGEEALRDAPLPEGGVTLVRAARNGGFAAGNNVALRWLLARGATGFAWLLNNDTVAAPGALRALVEAACDTHPAGVVGATLLEYAAPDRVQLSAGGTLLPWRGLGRVFDAGAARGMVPDRSAALRHGFICGGCMLVPLEAIREAGMLDERFFIYAEDADWSVRLARSGHPLRHAPAAEVWHKGGGATGRGSPMHDYHDVRSTLLWVRKHHPAWLPVALGYWGWRAVLPKMVRGEWTRLRAVLRAYRDGLHWRPGTMGGGEGR